MNSRGGGIQRGVSVVPPWGSVPPFFSCGVASFKTATNHSIKLWVDRGLWKLSSCITFCLICHINHIVTTNRTKSSLDRIARDSWSHPRASSCWAQLMNSRSSSRFSAQMHLAMLHSNNKCHQESWLPQIEQLLFLRHVYEVSCITSWNRVFLHSTSETPQHMHTYPYEHMCKPYPKSIFED
jgi:hypothetical protein